jgi:hypothetical protein
MAIVAQRDRSLGDAGDGDEQREGVSAGSQARYQDLNRQAKCRPMQACSQTTRGRENCRATTASR